MWEKFRPNLLTESLLAIDLTQLQAQGVKGIICDIDNTLLRWDKEKPDQKMLNWLQEAQVKGFKIIFLSNALPKRAQSIARLVSLPAKPKALKPFRGGFEKALAELDLDAKNVAMIGDQLFTDVLGGNRMGMYTVLVNPLGEKEFFSTKLLRFLERVVLKKLQLER